MAKKKAEKNGDKQKKHTKILCVSDEIDPLVYSKNVKERYGDVDLVLSAGDLPMRYLGFIVSMLNKPLYFVFGNHNLKHYHRFKHPKQSAEGHPLYSGAELNFGTEYFGSVYIDHKVKYIRRSNLIIVGLGGSMRYNNGENQYTEFQMYWKIFSLFPKLLIQRIFHGRWCDILLTHATPFGIHDKSDRCHVGFKAFLFFMRVFKPKYLLHGHVHLLDLNELREASYCETEIINVFGHYVLEVES